MKKITLYLFLLTILSDGILKNFGFEYSLIKICFIIILAMVYFYYIFANEFFNKPLFIFLSIIQMYVVASNVYIIFKLYN